MQWKNVGQKIEAAQLGSEVASIQASQYRKRAILRKPGTWANLPKAVADWDSQKLNAEIGQVLLDAKLF